MFVAFSWLFSLGTPARQFLVIARPKQLREDGPDRIGIFNWQLAPLCLHCPDRRDRVRRLDVTAHIACFFVAVK